MIWYFAIGLKICLKCVIRSNVCVEWTGSAWRIINIMEKDAIAFRTDGQKIRGERFWPNIKNSWNILKISKNMHSRV